MAQDGCPHPQDIVNELVPVHVGKARAFAARPETVRWHWPEPEIAVDATRYEQRRLLLQRL